MAASSSTATSQSKSIGVKIPTCKISLKDTFLTSPEELYRVFITQEVMSGFFSELLFAHRSLFLGSFLRHSVGHSCPWEWNKTAGLQNACLKFTCASFHTVGKRGLMPTRSQFWAAVSTYLYVYLLLCVVRSLGIYSCVILVLFCFFLFRLVVSKCILWIAPLFQTII